jgi:uncharacterized FlgJ-related protein
MVRQGVSVEGASTHAEISRQTCFAASLKGGKMGELIDPPSILSLSQADLEHLIHTIRERRDRVTRHRSIAHHRARNSSNATLGARLAKVATRLDKALIKLEADIAKCERMVSEVVTLRLEYGDATPAELAEELSNKEAAE